ncbi:MAG: type I DNA topoisomerase [Bacteroidales bacterium]|nr:type I DNA topoisomerase [Bacteroidales bacterium]NPV35646.1 type I DNA topoisomerase [Bacteroidales bacterium]
MAKNLVIVESPAKAKTIEKILGKDFIVKSSFGHIRDLNKNQLSIDIDKGFVPHYEIPSDKKKIVEELAKAAQQAETIWLASDEDREGEAIAWHLFEALKLKKENTKRIVFHEITKPAILHAVENPRFIDFNLVNAQQARRVLDRLVGYELSPLLWKKVKPALSAGRVQSVAVRLIVEKEFEIRDFKITTYYRVTGKFETIGKTEKGQLLAELNKRFETREETEAFLKSIIGASYSISGVETKPARRSPAPPFTTSTLQQEAARKLGFSVARTMMLAQELYESGLITYMRTDSVNLSDTALGMAKKEILNLFGENYLKIRKYTTKTKGAQEAHEAIRPTYLDRHSAGENEAQRKLYELIWKRTIASQMADAQLERTTITIAISTTNTEFFISKGEVVKFDGFLKVYAESTDDENDENESGLLPPVKKGDALKEIAITATQRFTTPPYRYTEASLVKKLEELGIGRPSTYAPTISTIQKREYVEKKDAPGEVKQCTVLTLANGKIKEETKTERIGQEKGKLFPTDIGILVTQFLMNHFDEIMDYNFTATVEKEFDEIAEGRLQWSKLIEKFYHPFHQVVEKAMHSQEKAKGERLLGVDPVSGQNVYVKIGRFGAMVQVGETNDPSGRKPKFAGLRKGQSIETITLQEALDLLKLPKTVGEYNGKEIVASTGRFGPYLMYDKAFFSIPKGEDPLEISLERAIEIIEEKKKKDAEKIIRTFPERTDVVIQNGRYGPYISVGKDNIPIPKGTDPASLSLEECLALAEKHLAGKKDNPDKAARKSTKKKK